MILVRLGWFRLILGLATFRKVETSSKSFVSLTNRDCLLIASWMSHHQTWTFPTIHPKLTLKHIFAFQEEILHPAPYEFQSGKIGQVGKNVFATVKLFNANVGVTSGRDDTDEAQLVTDTWSSILNFGPGDDSVVVFDENGIGAYLYGFRIRMWGRHLRWSLRDND